MKQSQYNLMFLIFFFVTSLCLWKVDSGVKQLYNERARILTETEHKSILQSNIQTKLIVREYKSLTLTEKERNCLALNVYFEARNQDTPGQIAVAFVTINRKLNKYFKNDVCEIVKQGYKKDRKSCAFSWYCDGVSDRPRDNSAWKMANRVANWTIENYYTQLEYYTDKPTHYHADYIKKPWWTKDMKRVAKIGNHIFYAGV